jgi:hypothetical protein
MGQAVLVACVSEELPDVSVRAEDTRDLDTSLRCTIEDDVTVDRKTAQAWGKLFSASPDLRGLRQEIALFGQPINETIRCVRVVSRDVAPNLQQILFRKT